jgi:hypothetical protein
MLRAIAVRPEASTNILAPDDGCRDSADHSLFLTPDAWADYSRRTIARFGALEALREVSPVPARESFRGKVLRRMRVPAGTDLLELR